MRNLLLHYSNGSLTTTESFIDNEKEPIRCLSVRTTLGHLRSTRASENRAGRLREDDDYAYDSEAKGRQSLHRVGSLSMGHYECDTVKFDSSTVSFSFSVNQNFPSVLGGKPQIACPPSCQFLRMCDMYSNTLHQRIGS